MGCWNETCLLSRLPITCGQEIACVFIAPVDAWPGTVYADSQYVPLSLPVKGRYDDYGRIEDMDPCPAALRSLGNTPLWSANDEDEKIRIDPPDPDDPDWREKLTDLVDMARQGHLWVENKTCKGGHAAVRLAFFHLDLWDYAVSQRIRQMTNSVLQGFTHWPAAGNIRKSDADARAALKELAAAHSAMELMRVAWQPTCGTGHQGCVDYPWQVKLYRKFADRADAFYKSGLY